METEEMEVSQIVEIMKRNSEVVNDDYSEATTVFVYLDGCLGEIGKDYIPGQGSWNWVDSNDEGNPKKKIFIFSPAGRVVLTSKGRERFSYVPGKFKCNGICGLDAYIEAASEDERNEALEASFRKLAEIHKERFQ